MSSDPPTDPFKDSDIKRLLADADAFKTPCELDLLLFLRRHPRTLLTNEKLAAMVGYEMGAVATAIDAFIEVGLVQRKQNPSHAARLYLLTAEGPRERALTTLLDIASTRSGRQRILGTLSRQPRAFHHRHLQKRGGLRAIG